jgi:hypothetical protein
MAKKISITNLPSPELGQINYVASDADLPDIFFDDAPWQEFLNLENISPGTPPGLGDSSLLVGRPNFFRTDGHECKCLKYSMKFRDRATMKC